MPGTIPPQLQYRAVYCKKCQLFGFTPVTRYARAFVGSEYLQLLNANLILCHGGGEGWAAVGGHGTMQLRPCSAEEAASAAAANAAWLEECVIHLLCVLALDRFGDYVSDQVSNHSTTFLPPQHCRIHGAGRPSAHSSCWHDQMRICVDLGRYSAIRVGGD